MKNIMKKALALLLTAVMLFSMVGTALAAGSGKVSISSSTNATPGAEVTLKVSIDTNPGFYSGTVDISFDERLTCVSCEGTNLFGDNVYASQSIYNDKNYVRIRYENRDLELLEAKTGVIATLTFAIPESATNGTKYSVSIKDLDFTDTDDSITFTGTGGTITVVTDEQFKITAEAGYNGSISPTSAMVGEGGSQTFTITPNDGYHIKDVKVDGTSVKSQLVAVEGSAIVKTYTMSNIDDSHKVTATFEAHSYIDTVTPPTCSAEGYTTHTCDCGYSYVDTPTKKLEHTWGDGVVTKEPTCTDKGVKTFTCATCGGTYTESIAATGHTWGDYVETTPATCVSEGKKTRTCTTCGATETEKIAATGEHTWNEGVVTKEPTCTEKGEKTHTCTVCGETKTVEIAALGGNHTWDEGKVTKEPTDTEKGEKTYTCTKCGATKTEEIAATGNHTWDEGQVNKPATCTEPGVMTYTCKDCDATRTELIPATGHKWDEGEETKAPTCTEQGVKTFTCEHCGDTYTENLAATGHKWDDGKCTICGQKKPDQQPSVSFVDVKPDAYYYNAVLWAVENGITTGTTTTTFSPDNNCTRGQAVTFLWRAFGCPEVESSATFSDVVKGSYYEKAVAWAVSEGITKGTSKTTFSPDATCTRSQIVTFLFRAEDAIAGSAVNPFKDVAESTYYYNAVLWAVENGITTGTTTTTFSPDNNCTRGQIVTFLFRDMAK